MKSAASASRFEDEVLRECGVGEGGRGEGSLRVPGPLVNDLQAYFGLFMLSDVIFEPECGILSGVPAGMSAGTVGPAARFRIKLHADDCGVLESMAGMDGVRAELRPAEARHSSFRLVLRDCRGGTSWRHGAMMELHAPAFLIAELAARSRLAELGRQLSMLGHELRQPLATISMANENLRVVLANAAQDSPHVVHALATIAEQVDRAQAMIRQTIDYAAGRASAGQPELAELARAAANAARLLVTQLEDAGIELELEPEQAGHRLPVALSQVELEQVLVNIVRNAAESIWARRRLGWNGTGRIAIRLRAEDTQFICEIADNGAGLSRGTPESGFQPFATTKGEEGTGLGLYLCEVLLAKAGGRMRLLPGMSEGARAEIILPRLTERAEATDG